MRRSCPAAWSVLFAGALVAGACSSGDDGALDPVEAPTTLAPVPGDPARPPAVDDPTGALDGGAPTDTADGGEPAAPPTTSGATPGAPPTTSAAPLPAPAAVGSWAPVYLRPAESARLVLEVRSQAGAEPRESSISHLRQVLSDNTGKEVGTSGGGIAGGARQWTAEAIREVADSSPLAQSRDAAIMRILFLRGGYAESDTVLGIAVRADVAAVFSDRVDEAGGLFGNPARIEDAVTLHEAGHLLGLVDLVLSTGRQDPEHPGHSRNRGSVMYYAVESTLVGSILGGGPPTELDDADRADLAAIRSGRP